MRSLRLDKMLVKIAKLCAHLKLGSIQVQIKLQAQLNQIKMVRPSQKYKNVIVVDIGESHFLRIYRYIH